jgi:hypothetical protein
LKQYLGVEDLSAITPKDLVDLRAVFQAIRDGETNWREVMEQRDAARGTSTAIIFVEKKLAFPICGALKSAIAAAKQNFWYERQTCR